MTGDVLICHTQLFLQMPMLAVSARALTLRPAMTFYEGPSMGTAQQVDGYKAYDPVFSILLKKVRLMR